MNQVRDYNNKRVLDISEDNRVVVIRKGNCNTIITANPDGTLNITHEIVNE